MPSLPTLDVLRGQVGPVFDRHPVAAVVAYGSLASGALHRASDIDLAVLPSRELSDSERDVLHDSLLTELAARTRLPELRLDVKFLPALPLVVRFKALQRGQPLYVRDESALRAELLRTAARYHDEYPFLRNENRRFFAELREGPTAGQ